MAQRTAEDLQGTDLAKRLEQATGLIERIISTLLPEIRDEFKFVCVIRAEHPDMPKERAAYGCCITNTTFDAESLAVCELGAEQYKQSIERHLKERH